ncbi:AAA-ATPase At2g46620-like [Vicia villosa]|uniref:AAA-ATPase At2g46620-like n=1 Tax=Vicia villosa TaxID=3911 RepID=UPI00273A7896|nr:AAA-ATPase At2g46620-like [Vicia villosa]
MVIFICNPVFFTIAILLISIWAIHKFFEIETVKRHWRNIEDFFHVYHVFNVPELNDNMQYNTFYRKLSIYLHSLPSLQDSYSNKLITSDNNQNDVVLSLAPNQTVQDHYHGAILYWFNQTEPNRTFILKIKRIDKRRILRLYLQHIHAVVDEIEKQRKPDLRLYMNVNAGAGARWRFIPFNHPSTFETITMESDLKNKLKSDLESFLKGKQYYHRNGRIWKRSFLLYGSSGTGKSTFVAAMANFLSYDIYHMDLSKLHTDSDLKSLFLQTTPKSIILVEDLDRFLAVQSSTALSLSAMLNFMDGICNGEERVMVFTMNSKDNVDPDLLRPGRVDVHIHFPLCDFSSFKLLASNYLGVKDHKLFPQVEETFQNGASLSPAEIGELMITNRNSPSRAIKSVITALKTDGDGRGCKSIERRRGNDGDDDVGEYASDHSFKERKKLYGFLKSRASRRKSCSSSPNNSALGSPLRICNS